MGAICPVRQLWRVRFDRVTRRLGERLFFDVVGFFGGEVVFLGDVPFFFETDFLDEAVFLEDEAVFLEDEAVFLEEDVFGVEV